MIFAVYFPYCLSYYCTVIPLTVLGQPFDFLVHLKYEAILEHHIFQTSPIIPDHTIDPEPYLNHSPKLPFTKDSRSLHKNHSCFSPTPYAHPKIPFYEKFSSTRDRNCNGRCLWNCLPRGHPGLARPSQGQPCGLQDEALMKKLVVPLVKHFIDAN
ncbi:hypothetical protein TIFTF001_016072 [Ficus carica]|uniref:Uncharacterized protein n=1 Tax=Ficus carica TaxID=3494 RepID=A0AA88D8F3_FICCA|nr:hypothetical protein TIFTF001_016072 [Ficus carica]